MARVRVRGSHSPPELDKFFRHFDDEFKNHESIHYST